MTWQMQPSKNKYWTKEYGTVAKECFSICCYSCMGTINAGSSIAVTAAMAATCRRI